MIWSDGTNKFIKQVLNNETSLEDDNEFFKDVNSILERKERLTENNIIIGSSLTINRNTQESFLDEDFSQIRVKLELVGNLFNQILKSNNINSDGKVEISNIIPSQYAKAEINYIKHFLLNSGNVFALRAFTGVAVPYGNSNYIPFSRSYYAGGSNDNRAWKAYKLGPGSSNNINEFNNVLNTLIDFANNNKNHFIQLETRNHHLPGQLEQDKTIIPNLYKMKPQCGMSAYLINTTAIKHFFSFLPWNKYIDVYTSDINNINKLNSLCYINNIFKTLGAQRQIDTKSQLGSIIYNFK